MYKDTVIGSVSQLVCLFVLKLDSPDIQMHFIVNIQGIKWVAVTLVMAYYTSFGSIYFFWRFSDEFTAFEFHFYAIAV